MNCKPGDLAIVVWSDLGNEGALVEVVGKDPERAGWWTVVALCGGIKVRGRNTRIVRPHNPELTLYACDAHLRPIRDQDGEDEILRIAGKPQHINA